MWYAANCVPVGDHKFVVPMYTQMMCYKSGKPQVLRYVQISMVALRLLLIGFALLSRLKLALLPFV